ncbi:MAG: beta-galactosidase, partial [Puniceicoccales bacterium]
QFLQPTPEKGRMRLWAYQSIAHGADGILHFRWRTCRYGAEIHWHGILDHDNIPRRRYQEFAREGQELQEIGNRILGTVRRIDVGISYSYLQDQAHAVLPFGRPRPSDQRELLLGDLMRRKIAVGYVNEADSYEGLSVLIVPSAVIEDRETAERIEAFVRSGGVLWVTATTGQRDENNHAIAETPPGLLRKVLGITVEEFGKTEHRPMQLVGDSFAVDSDYYEILECREAEALGRWRFTQGASVESAEGRVGLSCNSFGEGKAFYLGTYLNDKIIAEVWPLICKAAGVEPLAESDPNVCVMERQSEDRRLTFVLNHYPEEKSVHGLPPGRDLITREMTTGEQVLEPFGVAIIES